MIGIFDSGAGGLTAITELRKIHPSVDICFFADYGNAPYGTKKQGDLIHLVKRDILRLHEAGSDKILMACCTASTVHMFLPPAMKSVTLPIISPTAREAARVTKNGIIGVIATVATVHSGEFTKELSKHKNVKSVIEVPTQELVSFVERGASDGHISQADREKIYNILKPLRLSGIDTLILGCTHFAHLEREIGNCLPGVRVVNSSREGAKEIIKEMHSYGKGKTVYL